MQSREITQICLRICKLHKIDFEMSKVILNLKKYYHHGHYWASYELGYQMLRKIVWMAPYTTN